MQGVIAAVDPDARAVIVWVLVAAVCAVIAFLVFRLIAPAYQAAAALAAFLIVLLSFLLL